MTKKLNVLLILSIMLCLLSGCSFVKESKPIEDVHHLDGQNIGVMLASGPDYALTGRDDLKLTRYSRVSDLVTALCYRRVDAIAVESVLGTRILSSVTGIRIIEEPVAVDGAVAITGTDKEALLEEFNEFVSEFQTSAEYEDLVRRSRDTNGYHYKDIPLTDGDKILRVGIVNDNYPFTYINFETNEYEGIDIEILRHFANSRGYKLEFTGGTWEAMELGIHYGKIDIALSGISDLYRDDFVLSNAALVSDIYIPVDIVFIEIEDPDALGITSVIED